MEKLALATSGPCTGHLCDNCSKCRKGVCCGRDHPDYRLPELGDWGDVIYGELGILNDDGQKVECHCCGEWFQSLVSHLRTHNLLTREYKAIFGLSLGTPLISTDLCEDFREKHSDMLNRVRPDGSSIALRVTPEQRHFNNQRPMSLQGRKRLSAVNKGFVSKNRTPKHQYPCVVCGTLFFVPPARAGTHVSTCADPACKRAFRLYSNAKKASKLTMEQAEKIRRNYTQGGWSITEIARVFSVSRSVIYAILQGRTYRSDIWLRN